MRVVTVVKKKGNNKYKILDFNNAENTVENLTDFILTKGDEVLVDEIEKNDESETVIIGVSNFVDSEKIKYKKMTDIINEIDEFGIKRLINAAKKAESL